MSATLLVTHKVNLIEAVGFKALLSGSHRSIRGQAGLKTRLLSQVFRASQTQTRSTSLKKGLVHVAKRFGPRCTFTTCHTKTR